MVGMIATRTFILGWLSALLLAAVPWVGWLAAAAAPLVAVAALLLTPPWRIRLGVDPWAGGIEALSGLAAVGVAMGWQAAAGWLAGGTVVAVLAAFEGTGLRRREVTGRLALGAWALSFLLWPGQLTGVMAWTGGGLLLIGARRAGLAFNWARTREKTPVLGPPTREIRGELELRDMVGAAPSGLAATRPVRLSLEPGQSVALLLDRVSSAGPIVEAVRGLCAPTEGTVLIDGAAVDGEERLVAVVALGEPMLPGGVEENLAALCDTPVPESQQVAAREACSLSEVSTTIAESNQNGGLVTLHRLLLQAARVMVSHYRIVVVLDPSPWVNSVRGEIWRRAVVRASVGRTALWMTADRELARRADRVFVMKAGALAEEETQ